MKRAVIFIALILLCSSFVLASTCPPSLPKTYYGNVYYDGTILLGDYEIRAVMGEDTVGIGVVSGGNYEVDVSPCTGTTGVVKFYINGIGTNEDGSYNGMDDWGKTVNLNLSVNELPPTENTCGDGDIQPGEECDGTNFGAVTDCGDGWTGSISCSTSCQIDYSSCVVEVPEPVSPPSSGGGGGGGDGGSSSSSGTPVSPNDEGIIDLANNETEEDKEAQDTNQNAGTGTGAVIGFFRTGKGIGLLFGIAIMIAATLVLIVQKRKAK